MGHEPLAAVRQQDVEPLLVKACDLNGDTAANLRHKIAAVDGSARTFTNWTVYIVRAFVGGFSPGSSPPGARPSSETSKRVRKSLIINPL